MEMLQRVRRLSILDARLIGRDSLLRGMLLVPFGVALALRFAFPLILSRLERATGIELTDLYALVSSAAIVLVTPMLYGLVVGFLLIDQRDERTLQVLTVTPLSIGQYLAYRLFVPTLLTIPLTTMAYVVSGIGTPDPDAVVLAALTAAPITPLLALSLVAFADNKVQGMALQKALSLFLVLPLGGVVVSLPWAWLFGVLPTTWPLWVLWMPSPVSPVCMVAGLCYQQLIGRWLYRRFIQRSSMF